MASKIPPQVIQSIREKTDIVNVISQYVQLKKVGKNHSGLCPFHSEKTPSFTITEDKQMYYCFGCSKGGTVFQFFQDLEGISFLEAVKRVAEIEQIPFSYEVGDESENDRVQEHSSLLKMHEKAAKLYHHLLMNTEVGQSALSYLEDRGITEEIITTFQIGFAPDDRNFLSEAFSKDSWSEEDYLDSGLFTIWEDGKKSTRFHNRVMFPIRDEQGRVIAFSGQILVKDKDQAKYLNSPETKLFNKSKVLYNFDLARATIRKTNEVFLFEGFMDVIAAWSAGVKNGVASMGTSFTKEQLIGLSRVAKGVVIAYDGDLPGQEAIRRAIGEVQAQTDLGIQVLLLPELLDPDEYVQKYGPEVFYEFAMHGRSSVFEFQEEHLKIGKNLANETDKIAYVHEILSELSQVTSVLEREAYLNKIAKEFPEFSLEALREQLEVKHAQRHPKNSSHYTGRYETPSSPQEFDPGRRVLPVQEKAERMLLFWMIKNPGFNFQKNKLADFTFHSLVLQQLYESYLLFYELQSEFCEADFLNFLKEEEQRNTFSEILLLSKEESISDDELEELLATIRREEIKREIQERVLKQQAAKRIGNIEQEMDLALEIIELKRKI